MLERYFHLKEHGTSVKTELVAGLTTFATMAYILAVNPGILSAAGMDFGKVLRFHQNTGADITMVYYTSQSEGTGKNVVLETAENGLVADIAEKPAVYDGSKICMAIYLMEKVVFVDLVRSAYEHGGQDFLLGH